MPRKNKSNPSKGRGHALRSHLARKLHIPAHPPDIVTKPWFNVTVRHVFPSTTNGNLTASNILGAIRLQLFGSIEISLLALNIVFKINKIRVWGSFPPLAEGIPRSLQLTVYDFISLARSYSSEIPTRILEELTAFPDVVSRAAIGYVYSEEHRNIAIDGTGQADLPIVYVPTNSAFGPTNVLFYLDLSVRFGISATPPNVTNDLEFAQRSGFTSLFSRN